MLEGEYFIGMWQEDNHIYLKSNLDRIWKSTNVCIEHMDFVEEEVI